jgi:hypothetical protein
VVLVRGRRRGLSSIPLPVDEASGIFACSRRTKAATKARLV